MLIWFGIGILWQGLLLWRAIRMIESQQATGFAIVHGSTKFLLSVLLAGWMTGSLYYLLRRKP